MDLTEKFEDVLDALRVVGDVESVSSPMPGLSATVRLREADDERLFARIYGRFNDSVVLCLDLALSSIRCNRMHREALRNATEWLPFCSVRFDRATTNDTWDVYLTHSLLVEESVSDEAISQAVGSMLHTKQTIMSGPLGAVISRTRSLATSSTAASTGKTDPQPQSNRDDAPVSPAEADATVSNLAIGTDETPGWKNPALRVLKRRGSTAQVIEELNRLVGLRPVKDAARTLVANHKVQKLRRQAGMKVQEPAPHLVFVGNPGTGKTTVARLFGQLYRSLGLLSKGHVVEAKRSDLVAAYLGQTALRTRAICEKALDGVLFIDEAYSLVGSDHDYGSEAIEELLTQMETHRGRLVVIIAGYPDEIARLLESNPGLQSRFDRTIQFPDFDDAQLLQILRSLAADADYELSVAAVEEVRAALEMLERGDKFGNARDVRTIFETILQAQAFRLARESNVTDEELRTIEAGDVAAAQRTFPRAASIGGRCRRGRHRGDGWGGYL